MRTHTAFALLAALAATTLAARAEDADVKTAGYKLKNRSVFSSPETARAPFWPIGWAKPVAGQVTQQVEQTAPTAALDPEQFSVTSILVGSPSIAIINGKPYGQGEFIRAAKPKDSKAAAAGVTSLPPGTKVRVARVSDGAVVLELNGQYTQLTLRRPDLQLHARSEAEEGADLLKPLAERP
jgi:hypothetical protein